MVRCASSRSRDSHPSMLKRISSGTPCGYQSLWMLKSSVENGTVQSALCICGFPVCGQEGRLGPDELSKHFVDVYSHELVFLLFCNVPLCGQTSLYIAFCKSDCVKWFLSAIFLHASPGRRLGVFSHVFALCLLPLWTAQSYALFMFWMRAHFKLFILFSYWFVEVFTCPDY